MPSSNDVLLPQTVDVKVAGAALSQLQREALIEIRVDLSVSVASRAVIVLSDAEFLHVDGNVFVLGKEVEVGFPQDRANTVTTVFKGEITAIGIDQAGERKHRLVVEASDRSHRFDHESKVRTFLNETYAGMARTVAGERNLGARTAMGSGLGQQHPYMLHTGTDRALLDTIARRTGTEWFVDGTDLVLRERTTDAPIVLTFGEDLLRFKARASAGGHVDEVTVRSWDPQTKQAIATTKTAAAVAPLPGSAAPIATTARGKASLWSQKVRSAGLVPQSTEEANHLAAGALRRATLGASTVRGETFGLPKMKAGSVVTINKVGRSMSGDYYVTEVQHLFAPKDGYRTRFTAGGHDPSTLVDMLGRESGSGRWGTGLVVGVVTNNKDPQHQGRVKVKFPSISDSDESNWARVASIGAGPKKGFHVLPDVNDEVIVGFEQGDLRRPYVIGGVWNGVHKPPETSEEAVKGSNVNQWTMRTRLGHVLTMHDGTGPDDQFFKVALSEAGTKLHLGLDKIELITDKDNNIEIKNGKASILLAASGDVTIKGENIKLQATTNIDLASQRGGITLKASAGKVAVDGATGLDLKGVTVKVDGSGMVQIKGGMVQVN